VILTDEDKIILEQMGCVTEEDMKKMKYKITNEIKKQKVEAFAKEETNKTMEKLYGYESIKKQPPVRD
jgi:hypothetical protein